ncbi:MAG: alpha-L-rhamnosidase C-terminal domain-containing protein [Planctomycetota bacterium]
MRVTIEEDPFADWSDDVAPWQGRGHWPARWVSCPQAAEPPFVTAYRLGFSVDEPETVRVHVSADERYELFLDGHRAGRGPERGDPDNWFFETYQLDLDTGSHVLVARVWSLGDMAPMAQMSHRPGFILCPQAERHLDRLATGRAEWQAKTLGGYSFAMPEEGRFTGANVIMDGAELPWGVERGEGDGWERAAAGPPGQSAQALADFDRQHLLRPAGLPAMMEKHRYAGSVRLVAETDPAEAVEAPVRSGDHLAKEESDWSALLAGEGAVTVPADARRRVLIDLEDYYCAYPELTTSGGEGARVRVEWAESLFSEPGGGKKGNRDEVEGKFFAGTGDTFLPDGGEGRRFSPLWWQAGRYVQILVETAEEPLALESFLLRETRYPLEMESEFHCDVERLPQIVPIAVRGLQMCSHETYMDCPYYEQLMYAGDTRLEALTTYALTADDRLPRKALREFDYSRIRQGMTRSRFPSRRPQIIPGFSLWWIGMVHDYALWRDDARFVRARMPGVRAVIEDFLTFLNEDGLLEAPRGWGFMDWVPDWRWGVPPEAERGVSGPLNWLLALNLMHAARLEDHFGELELASRDRRLAQELAARIRSAFWDEERGLFADDLTHEHYSEHGQVLAILSGLLPTHRQAQVGDALLSAEDLARTTIYFTHYTFEAYRRIGHIEALFDRLELWYELSDLGFKTTYESGPEGRSDCHAWGAYPVWHYFATVLGVRPAEMGFHSVEIAPQLGPVTSAYGSLPHPRGEVEVEFVVENGALRGFVVLPDDVAGTLTWGAKSVPLEGGRQEVFL